MRLILATLLLSGTALPAPAADETKPTIAVMDFSASNVPAGDAVIVSGFVRAAVVRSGKFLVVEKNNMDKVLAEQAFQQTGCTTSECAVKMGRLLNARKMVIGEFALLGGVRFLTASLVDVETGAIERTGRVKGFEVATADEAADRLVSQLTGVSVAPGSEVIGKVPSRPPRSRTRVGFGVGANYVGMGMDAVVGSPSGGLDHPTKSYARADMMGSVSLRFPLGGGRFQAGLDAEGGVIVDPVDPQFDSVSGQNYQYQAVLLDGSPAIIFGLAGTFVVGLTERLGLKLAAGLRIVKISSVAIRRIGSAAATYSVIGERTRSTGIISTGLEWFVSNHLMLEATAGWDQGGVNRSLEGAYDFAVSFDALRLGAGLKLYL